MCVRYVKKNTNRHLFHIHKTHTRHTPSITTAWYSQIYKTKHELELYSGAYTMQYSKSPSTQWCCYSSFICVAFAYIFTNAGNVSVCVCGGCYIYNCAYTKLCMRVVCESLENTFNHSIIYCISRTRRNVLQVCSARSFNVSLRILLAYTLAYNISIRMRTQHILYGVN